MTTVYFCPSCGHKHFAFESAKQMHCGNCGFTYFHNVAAAVSVFVTVGDEGLFLQRAAEPKKGLWGLPGGFIDQQESAEDALIRECYEEVAITLTQRPVYIGTWANQYFYKNVNYHTLDMFYQINLSHKPELILQQSEVAKACWLPLKRVLLADLAFESAQHALSHLRQTT